MSQALYHNFNIQNIYHILLVSGHGYYIFHVENGAVINRDFYTEIMHKILTCVFQRFTMCMDQLSKLWLITRYARKPWLLTRYASIRDVPRLRRVVATLRGY